MKDVNWVVIFVQYFAEKVRIAWSFCLQESMEEATVFTSKKMDFRKKKVVMELN